MTADSPEDEPCLPKRLSGRGIKRALRKNVPPRYGTLEVAAIAGVTWRTLYRWLAAGKLPEPERGENRIRAWTPELVAQAVALSAQINNRPRRTGDAANRSAEPQGRDG
jgi:hypothetical protein